MKKNAPVNYVATFSQSNEEYNTLYALAQKLGRVVQTTPTGDIFAIEELETACGKLQLVKVRKPDRTKPERGNADFAVDNYTDFKKTYLSQNGFRLIMRPDHEMLELTDPAYNVRVYFADPRMDKVLELK